VSVLVLAKSDVLLKAFDKGDLLGMYQNGWKVHDLPGNLHQDARWHHLGMDKGTDFSTANLAELIEAKPQVLANPSYSAWHSTASHMGDKAHTALALRVAHHLPGGNKHLKKDGTGPGFPRVADAHVNLLENADLRNEFNAHKAKMAAEAKKKSAAARRAKVGPSVGVSSLAGSPGGPPTDAGYLNALSSAGLSGGPPSGGPMDASMDKLRNPSVESDISLGGGGEEYQHLHWCNGGCGNRCQNAVGD